MTLDPSTLRGLKSALEKGDGLALAYQAQTGALNKTQEEATRRILEAKRIRESAEAEAQKVYSAIETKARLVRDTANAASGVAYGEIEISQNAKIVESQQALKQVESALRALEQKILNDYGVTISLFPSKGSGQTIRVG